MSAIVLLTGLIYWHSRKTTIVEQTSFRTWETYLTFLGVRYCNVDKQKANFARRSKAIDEL